MSKIKPLDISVIIPFKNKSKMTIDCLESFLKYGPAVKEILLISNNSEFEEFNKVKNVTAKSGNVKLYEYNQPFNYQKMNNWAVELTSGSFLLFLNNDTELVENSRGLIEKMFLKSKDKNVGVCGCLLLFGDKKTIQHGGVFLMPEGQADHLYASKKYKEVISGIGSEKFPYDITKNIPMSAVTGACQLVDKNKFMKINMMDERFIICGGDVDLCLRMNEAGFQTWFIGGGYILHKESQSRKFTPIPYSDFYYSYLSYIKSYSTEFGDPFLPDVTKKIIINGV